MMKWFFPQKRNILFKIVFVLVCHQFLVSSFFLFSDSFSKFMFLEFGSSVVVSCFCIC